MRKEELKQFLSDLSGTPDLFQLFQKLGIFGSEEMLFAELNKRLEYCLNYLNCDLPTLTGLMQEYNNKQPEKNFEAINKTLYQDKLHPVVMDLFYVISEPFLLRKKVKEEMLSLAFKLAEIKNVLIAGIGCGEILEIFAGLLKNQSTLNIHGIDISQSSIDFCSKKSAAYQFKTKLEVKDLDSYGFSGNYDLVEFSEVLEHVRNPQDLLANARAHAKLALVTVPIMLDVPDHLHLFNPPQIVEMLKKAGYSIIYQTLRNSFYVPQYFYFALLK